MKDIKVSPWKLNLVAAQVRGMPLKEAVANMKFSKKKQASNMLEILQILVTKAKKRTLTSQELVVYRCFVTQGKRQRYMRVTDFFIFFA